MEELLKGLNPEQKEAAQHTRGPLLILAGAGSGKTRVLTTRMALLIGKKVCKPSEILAVTFTNKAANEMRERVAKTVRGRVEGMVICTCHSLGNRLLHEFHGEAGLSPKFGILSEGERRAILYAKLRRVKSTFQDAEVKWISNQISLAKNRGISPEQFPQDIEKGPLIARVYAQYEKEVRALGKLDFDDLLIRPLSLLKQDAAVLKKLRKRFTFLSVDEYQDTNAIQFDLLRLLANPENNICAVGDDDQGIYGWRGADISNILQFNQSFPGTHVIRLERNYRSTKHILAAANAVIEKNTRRTPKKLWSSRIDGETIEAYRGEDEEDEAEWVAQKIRELNGKGLAFTNIALLYRTHAQSRIYEEAFVQKRIPYSVAGGAGFFDSKEVADLMAYLRFLADPSDEDSLERALKVPSRGFSPDVRKKVLEHATARECSFWEAIRSSQTLRIRDEDKKRFADFSGFAETFMKAFAKMPLSEAFEQMVNAIGYRDFLKRAHTSDPDQLATRLARVDELGHSLTLYARDIPKGGLIGYLRHVAILEREREENETQRGVSLLTIHASKGMEFKAVFAVGLDDEVMPSKKSVEEGHIEEERRLFYVTLTRAQDRLFLSWPGTKLVRNQSVKCKRCRFLNDIPEETLLHPLDRDPVGKKAFFKNFFEEMRGKFVKTPENAAAPAQAMDTGEPG